MKSGRALTTASSPSAATACMDTAKFGCEASKCSSYQPGRRAKCPLTCGLCPPSAPPSSPLPPLPPSTPPPKVSCEGFVDGEVCQIKKKKCNKNPPRTMNKCKKKCNKDRKRKKKHQQCQQICCQLFRWLKFSVLLDDDD